MDPVHHRVNPQSGLIGGILDPGGLRVVLQRPDLHQVETDIDGQLETIEIGQFPGQHRDENRLLHTQA